MKKLVQLAALVGLLFSSFAVHATEPIKIGMFLSLTGDYASEGQDSRRVAELFIENLNAKGGINGEKVELVIEDAGSSPRLASAAATRIVATGAKMVVGTYGSALTEAAQDIFDEAGMVHVADAASLIRLTEKGLDKFFRIGPRDDAQGLFTATTLNNLGFKKIAILHDNTSFAKGLAEEVAKFVAQNPQQSQVFFDALVPQESDYSVVLTSIRATQADVIVFTGYYSEAGLLLRQRREMGWDIPIISGDAANHADVVTIAGVEAAHGYRFTSPPLPTDIDNEAAREFLALYHARYNSYPGSIWSFIAADTLGVLVAAIEARGDDPQAIADFLHNEMKDYQGFTSLITFDHKGDRIGDFYRLYEVDETGKFILQP